MDAIARAQRNETVMSAAAYVRHKWSRTDTARWLNDRNERVLAWVRRNLPRAPVHSKQIGYWLREFSPAFDRAHARLSALPAAARDGLLIEEALR